MSDVIKKSLGGDRLGSGAKMDVSMHNYERSSHDMGSIWRSSMSAGTLVPFMNILALPGDTFDIDLNADVKTLPTRGPLFGSLKLQLDVFFIPYRLYQAVLHNNKLNIGMDMANVKLPQVQITAKNLNPWSDVPLEFQQINQSSLLAYLGIRGVGRTDGAEYITKNFNAMAYIGYWDVYKNYYANKQEEIGTYIHTSETAYSWDYWTLYNIDGSVEITETKANWVSDAAGLMINNKKLSLRGTKGSFDVGKNIMFTFDYNGVTLTVPWDQFWADSWVESFSNTEDVLYGRESQYFDNSVYLTAAEPYYRTTHGEDRIKIETFPLANIDTLREEILACPQSTVFEINTTSVNPLNSPLIAASNGNPCAQFSQEGLALKTYQSDIFNNWLSTEWIDGVNGINEISKVSTAGDYFTIDDLQFSKKVYDMLNRIAVSGGSYNDWMEAVYGMKPYGQTENPVYMGGLSKEVIFNQVVSLTPTEQYPLGTLAGQGTMANKHKGGKLHVRVNEPGVLMGIVSLTPRIDYSQGNDFVTELKTMNDLHKPAMDNIGWQELITNTMAFWDSEGEVNYSAGKQPAWLWYMTDINKTYGNFADPRKEMFMTLNRRYEPGEFGRIKDLTTYIDPSKYNYMFAEANLDSQNYWVQIAKDITARRKISAKLMPNL